MFLVDRNGGGGCWLCFLSCGTYYTASFHVKTLSLNLWFSEILSVFF